jgi:hypothetical protein
MKRNRRAAAIWDAVLLGVPLLIAGILTFDGWPLGNARVLLLVIFAAEVFVLLVPPTFYGAGGGWNSGMGDTSGARGMPSYEGFEAVVNQKRFDSVRRTALDPAAIGPAVCLALLGLSFLIWS